MEKGNNALRKAFVPMAELVTTHSILQCPGLKDFYWLLKNN
jgi:hypothetical protein